MSSDQEAIISYFDGDGSVRSDTFFTEDGVLYAYGKHWPMALMTETDVYINIEKRSAKSPALVSAVSNALSSSKTTLPVKQVKLSGMREVVEGRNGHE